MSFCLNCGSPLTAENRFCPRCGSPAPAPPPQQASYPPPQAPQQQRPPDPVYPYPPQQQQQPPYGGGYPYQQPPQPQQAPPPYQQYPPQYQQGPPPVYQQPRGGSKKGLWIVLILVLLLGGGGAVWWFLLGASPTQSVDRAAAAFEKQDLSGFDTYVDSEAVVRDLLDQSEKVKGPTDETKQVRAHIPEVADAMKRALLGLPPPPNESPEVQKLAPTGDFAKIRTLIKYKGAASETGSGSDTLVTTNWTDPTGLKTQPLVFKMNRSWNHWKIVGFTNPALK